MKNVCLMMYREGREIFLLKDEFEKLKPMAKDLEERGITVTFLDADKEQEVRAILEKHGGIRQTPN